MGSIVFTIPGAPRGKARPRATARIIWKDGRPEAVVSVHTPKQTRDDEKAVLLAFQRAHPNHLPFTGPVLLKFVAVHPIPASWPKRLKEAAARGTLFCVTKPDKDNIEKLIVDALTPPKRKRGSTGPAPSAIGYAWVDDQQVMGGGLKRYGSPPRVEVTLQSLESPDVPATPGQARLDARVAAGGDHIAPRQRRLNPPNADRSKHPPQLQLAIDRAIARDDRERGK